MLQWISLKTAIGRLSNSFFVVITQELHTPERALPIKRHKYLILWWPRAESNHRHKDFQSSALPTELLGHLKHVYILLAQVF